MRDMYQTAQLAILAAVSLAGTSLAGTTYWGGASGAQSWNDPANWSGGVKPGAGDTASLQWPAVAPTTISLDAPQTILKLAFEDWSDPADMSIGTAADVLAGNTLTLTSVFRGDYLASVQSVNANVVLGGDGTWEIRNGWNGYFAVNGNISGGYGITKTGNGVLVLNGNNSYTGTTTVSTGTLQLGGSLSGSLVNNATVVFNHATTASVADVSGAGSITKKGSGTLVMTGNGLGSGALTIEAGGIDSAVTGLTLANSSYAWNGDFTFAGTNDLGLGTGAVSMNADRTVTVKAGTLSVNGAIGSARKLTKAGDGTLEINAAGSYSGGTVVNGGTLKLANSGKAGTGALTVGSVGTVVLDNTTANADRLADASAVTLSGKLNLVGNNTAATSETAGVLTLGAAGSVITLTPGATQSAALTFASPARNTGATSLFRGEALGSALGTGTSNILFTTRTVSQYGAFAATDGVGTTNTPNAAVLRGVLVDTSATGAGLGFATYGANGVRLLDSATEQTTTYAGGSANVRLELSADQSITGAATNTLQLHNVSGGSKTVTNSGTSLIPHNGLLFSGDSAITLTGGTLNANLDTNNSEAIILSTNTAGVNIGTTITGKSVTFAGPGNFNINAPISGGAIGTGFVRFNGTGTTTLAAAETGPVIINAGTLKLATGASLYSATSTSWSETVDLDIARFATLDLNGISAKTSAFKGAGSIINSAAGLATLTTDWQPSGSNYADIFPDFSGNISGNIKLVIGGGGYYITKYTQILSGNNSFTGGVTLNNAAMTLSINSPTALGTGTLTIGGGKINTNASGQVLTTNNAVAWNNNFEFKGSGNLDLGTGAVTLGAANPTVTVSANTLTIGGSIGQGAVGRGFTKAGVGTLVLRGNNTYTGATTVNAGTLTVASGAVLSDATAPLVVNNPNTGAGTTVTLNLNSAQTVGSLSGTLAAPSSGSNAARINLNGAATGLTVNQTADNAFAGAISGNGSFTLGSGSTKTLTLSGTHTYTGSTNIAGGRLLVTGGLSTSSINVSNAAIFEYSGSNTLAVAPTLNDTATFIYNSSAKLGGDLTVAAGRTLGGSGTFANVTVSGLLKPGNSPGLMTVDSLTLSGTPTSTMEIGGSILGTEYDNVTVAGGGTITYAGTLNVVAYGGYDLTQPGNYNLFSFTGTESGAFASVNVGAMALADNAGVWTGSEGSTTYTFAESTGTLAVTIPEPATVGLLLFGMGFGLGLRRTRKGRAL